MGPRGHGLDCTTKHLWVLTSARPAEDVQGTGRRTQTGKVEKLREDVSPLSVRCLSAVCPLSVRCQVAPQETDNVSRLLAKQAKAIRAASALPSSTTCSHSPLVTVFQLPRVTFVHPPTCLSPVCVALLCAVCSRMCEKGPECNIQKDLNPEKLNLVLEMS